MDWGLVATLVVGIGGAILAAFLGITGSVLAWDRVSSWFKVRQAQGVRTVNEAAVRQIQEQASAINRLESELRLAKSAEVQAKERLEFEHHAPCPHCRRATVEKVPEPEPSGSRYEQLAKG